MRPEFLEHLRRRRSRYNRTPHGPWILAPEAACAPHARAADVSIETGAVLLLMTDGFFALATEYGRRTPTGLVGAGLELGLAALVRELRHVERADPAGLRFPRYKTSDDATALLLRVE